MSGPVIGIAGAGYVVPRFWGELPVRGVPTTYVDAVGRAGGRPLILPPGHAVDLLDLVDGVVLAGGDDIGDDPARDRAEIELVDAARDRRLPLLAVCRGLQLATVADGGSLIPDLALTHVLPDVGHPVTTTPGSLISSLLGKARPSAPCTTRRPTGSAPGGRQPPGPRTASWRRPSGSVATGRHSACSGTRNWT